MKFISELTDNVEDMFVIRQLSKVSTNPHSHSQSTHHPRLGSIDCCLIISNTENTFIYEGNNKPHIKRYDFAVLIIEKILSYHDHDVG